MYSKRFGLQIAKQLDRVVYYSTAASSTKRAGTSTKYILGSLGGLSIAYGAAFYYALENDRFRSKFEKLPLTHSLLDWVEEQVHQRRQRQSYEYHKARNNTVTPYIKSQRPKTEDDDKTFLNDPLSPEKFFDAQSGQVGGSKDYLPLLLLPDVRDPIVNEVSIAMNDLIACYNSNASSRQAIDTVARALVKLSRSVAKSEPVYSRIFTDKAQLLKRTEPGDRANLAAVIMETENDLVSHINSRPAPLENKSSLSPQRPRKPQPPPQYFDSALNETILKLQLTLTLLISALHNHQLPVTSYIQDVKETVETYSPRIKEKLINDALEGLAVPKDVNLQPIIRDIVDSSSKK